MTAATYQRRASIGHAPPLFGTADDNNEWHKKIRDILDVSSSDPALFPPTIKKTGGPNRRRSMDDGVRPVLRVPTNRIGGLHADKNHHCHTAPNKDHSEKAKAKSVHVSHEESTASLSWSARSKRSGEGLEFSLSSFDVSPASPSSRRDLSCVYPFEHKKSNGSSLNPMKHVEEPVSASDDVPLSPLSNKKPVPHPLNDEDYVSPLSIKVRHFSKRASFVDASPVPLEQSPKSVRNHSHEDLDSSFFDAREEKFDYSKYVKSGHFHSRKSSSGSAHAAPFEKQSSSLSKEHVSPSSSNNTINGTHVPRLNRADPLAVPFTFEKQSTSTSSAKQDPPSQNKKVNRNYSRRLSCSDAPDPPSTFMRRSLRSPFNNVDDYGHILGDPIQSPQTAAHKFSISVRRSSSGNTAPLMGVPLPFPTQRRDSVKRYGRRGSETSFYLPLEKVSNEGMHAKEADREPSTTEHTNPSCKGHVVHPESGLPRLHQQRRSLNHGDAPRELGADKVRRRASCCEPHPKLSEAGMKTTMAREVPSELDVDRPPISFIVCKKISKESKVEEPKSRRGHPTFAYF
ncbi:hypothetical protein ACHAWX_005348 [Stephanocyclus meneghinianus]